MNAQTDPPSNLFAAGDYASVAMNGQPGDWQTFAALGLVGKAQAALEGLKRFDHPEAKFYSAAASWIDGDDRQAERLLKDLRTPHAQNLLALIRKQKIQVLAQLDRGSQWDFITALQHDTKFAVQNIGFRTGDLPNKPVADVHQFYDRRNLPDFYAAKLVEWHVLPPNLQELPCPILGHTADYDIHIQTVQPWLQLFDELVVTDPTEWADVSRLVNSPVSAFPKAFGLGGKLPAVPAASRPTDIFVSGTALHPYHPDKARLLHQILAMPEPTVKFVNGFLGPAEYHQLLGQTKVGFTYVRHPGAMPTRGLESLAMGAAIAVQEGSVLQLFVGENEGVVTYDLNKQNLPEAVRRILSQWPEFERRARRGAALVRKEFDLARVASQYFRFLTFLAAKPRGPRRLQPRASLDQKRSILLKGWVQSPRVNKRMRQQVLVRGAERLAGAAAPRVVIDMVRELILEYTTAAYQPVARDYSKNFQVRLAVDRALLVEALRLCRQGVRRFPDSLVLRFNWIRAALHFGEREEVSEALALAEETLQRPLGEWQIDVMDDVFPWDYFSQFFNYRAYFDACTSHLQTGEPATEKLGALLVASLRYYVSFCSTDPGHALEAVRLDPAYPFYQLQCARQLARRGQAGDFTRAAELLIGLSEHSMLFLQAFELLEQITARDPKACHPETFAALSRKVRQAQGRLWTASYGIEDWDAIPLRVGIQASACTFKQNDPHPDPLPSDGRGNSQVRLAQVSKQSDTPTDGRRVSLSHRTRRAVAPSQRVGEGRGEGERAAKSEVVFERDLNLELQRPKILFLPLEIADWKQARHLSYAAQMGLEEGLAAQGVEFVTMPILRGLSEKARSHWLRQVRERCAGQRFDQVWLEIVHSEMTAEFLQWLAELAPVRLGFLMESLCYDDEALTYAPQLRHRRALAAQRFPFLTHVAAVDELDAAALNERGLVKSMWWPQAVPARSILPIPQPSPDQRALFYGQLYGQRQNWLDHPMISRLLWRPDHSPEEARGYPRLFDDLNRAFGAMLEREGSLDGFDLGAHLAPLRDLRRVSFDAWLASLQNGAAVVNLPSLFQGYAGRVYEAMAAGRPVVSWEVPKRPRTRALFSEGEEILLFPAKDPGTLAAHLRSFQQEPERAQQIAQRAQNKLRRCHTIERRTQQILEWAATGLEPNFSQPAHESAAPASAGAGLVEKAVFLESTPYESSPASSSPEAARLLLASGETHHQFGHDEKACEQLQRAAAMQPEDPITQTRMVASAWRLGRWPEIEATLSRVLKQSPDQPDVWRMLGGWSLDCGLFPHAAEIYHTLLRREPFNRTFQVNLALAQLGGCAKTSVGQGVSFEQKSPHPDPLPSDGRGNSKACPPHSLKRFVTPTDGPRVSLSHRTRRAVAPSQRVGEGRGEGECAATSEVVFEPVLRDPSQPEQIHCASALMNFLQQHLPLAVAAAEQRAGRYAAGQIPAAARRGGLGQARALLEKHELRAAWDETEKAIDARPFHPEGFLLLAEIAATAGDIGNARECARQASRLAPKWKAARKFLKALPPKGGPAPCDLPHLPERYTHPGGRLSVCLITKNEERFIGQCLESVREVADQIIVLDTGSTDWTKEIAARFGAEVHSFEWMDDFSAARNAALEHATGDWVLVLDADEELDPKSLDLLRQEMKTENVMAFRLPLIDVGKEEEGRSYVPRLFRNAPGLFFVGRVHEQAFTSIEVRRAEWGLENRLGQTLLRHHGYAEEVMRERNKNARNLALIERALEEMPNEPNLLMNYGLELNRADRLTEALEQYAEAFRLMSALPHAQIVPEFREALLTQYGSHLLTAKDYAGVVQVLRSPLAKTGGLTASHHFLIGLAFMETQNFAEAATELRQSQAKRDQPVLSVIHKGVRQGGPNHCLAICLNRLKQPETAERAFRAALTENPQSRSIQCDWALFLTERGQPVEALKVLHQLVTDDGGDAAIWVIGGQIALSRPEFLEFARDWTGEAIKRFPEQLQIVLQHAHALLLSQDVERALPLWRQAGLDSHPGHLAARVICELLQDGTCDVDPALEPAVSQEFLKWYRALVDVGARNLVETLNQKIDALQRVLPSASRMLEEALREAGNEVAA